nr:MAG TPA: hypothetical protein [Caudoviricetes sp.]
MFYFLCRNVLQMLHINDIVFAGGQVYEQNNFNEY